MKTERPILFSTPMVQAYMLDLKTQTRRTRGLDKINDPDVIDDITFREMQWYKDGSYRAIFDGPEESFSVKSPYGGPGDILWMRETWRIVGWNEGDPFIIEFKDGKRKREVYLNESRALDYAIECSDQCEAAGYKADEESGMFEFGVDTIPTKWRPSIFMPKAACRNRMTVIDIYPERLQDISEGDAIAEGVDYIGRGVIGSPIVYKNYLSKGSQYLHSRNNIRFTAIDSYKSLCESINGKGSWDKNNWVWKITFERIQP
jgi:hypothetical protein